MSLTKRVGLVAGAAAFALTLTGGILADNDSDVLNRMQSDIADLQRENKQLKAQVNGDWLTEERADGIRSLVQDVLADADTRANLMANGVSAGYDDGAVIQSADGDWRLKTNIHMQQRFIYNNQDVGEEGDDDRYGFENTRTKFILSGNVLSPDWIYKITINVGSPDDTLGIWDELDGVSGGGHGRGGAREAWIGHKFSETVTLRVGSMKAPFLREELVDSIYQLAVERSALNYIYTLGYTDGVVLDYQGEQFRVMGSVNDGANSGQTPWNVADVDFSLTGRAEFKFSGTWDQFDDFTSPTGDESGIMAGGAIHYQSAEDDPGAGIPDVDLLGLTADISLEFGGWNAFAAVMYFDYDPPTSSSFNPWGLLLQGGVMVAADWELYARYEYADYDVGGALSDLGLITVGVNRYFGGHNAKWTLDIMYGFDEVELLAPSITGLRTDGPGEDGQFVIRNQLQIVF